MRLTIIHTFFMHVLCPEHACDCCLDAARHMYVSQQVLWHDVPQVAYCSQRSLAPGVVVAACDGWICCGSAAVASSCTRDLKLQEGLMTNLQPIG
jgi:hypothetical protein